jgi:hypothetical protein
MKFNATGQHLWPKAQLREISQFINFKRMGRKTPY